MEASLRGGFLTRGTQFPGKNQGNLRAVSGNGRNYRIEKTCGEEQKLSQPKNARSRDESVALPDTLKGAKVSSVF
jgi:hypothetical protein